MPMILDDPAVGWSAEGARDPALLLPTSPLPPRLAQHITYVHQHSRQPPAQFEPLDMKLMR